MEDQQQRLAFTHVIMNILDMWRISPTDQITLLHLPKATRPRALRRYHENTPLPDEPEIMQRAEHILGIAEALRTTYPHNLEMGARWMNMPNRRFDNQRPVDMLLQQGMEGFVSVRIHLDCAYGWSLTD